MIIIHAVNEDHPQAEIPPRIGPTGQPLPRLLAPLVEKALATFPVVAITGARQAGKSTLAREIGRVTERVYRTLDDLEVLERSRLEPDGLVRSAARLTLDEVQRSPDLLLAVKRAVDEAVEPRSHPKSRNQRPNSCLTRGVSLPRRQASAAFFTTSAWVG